MKNPFDNLPGSDDEDNAKFIQVGNQSKNTAQKKPAVQQPRTQAQTRGNRPNVNDNLVINQRENTKNHKSDREQKPVKEITDHRAHDRKSGTGRVSEPRKGGGGRGGIGTMKDELNKDKILGRVNEDGEGEQEPEKEPQPEALTLEEYYAREGLDISNLDKKRERVVNKDAPKADWIAKEKLEIVKSKQDNVLEGETKRVAVLKNQLHKVETSSEQELLGFTSTAPKKQHSAEETKEREPRDNRDNRDNKRGNDKGGKGKYEEKKTTSTHPKLVITEEDFPSL